MENPTLWDQIVASKTVIWMFLTFLVFVAFLFRPGAGQKQRESANSIFRNDDKPAPDRVERSDAEPAGDDEKEARS